MPVFDSYGLKCINDLLNMRFENMLLLQPCELTADHFLEAFVRPEDRDTLTRARTLVDGESTHTVRYVIDSLIGPGAETLNGSIAVQNPSFLTPSYMRPLKFAYMNDNEAADAIVAWAYEMHELVREIVSLKTCLGYLNIVCSEAPQIAAYLPALRTHLTGAEDREQGLPEHKHTFRCLERYERRDFTTFNRLRKRLISGAAPKTLPRVPRAIINECRDANTLLLRCALTLETDDAPQNAAVQANIHLASQARRSPAFKGTVVNAILLPERTIELQEENFE